MAPPDAQHDREFRSPVYTLGCVVATTSWGFHVAALALAPISVVQSVIAGGLVLVTGARRPRVRPRGQPAEWIGVALSAAGLAFLAATLGATGDSAHADYDGWVLLAVVGLGTAIALGLVAARGAVGPALAGRRPGWGRLDITIKALSGKTEELGARRRRPPVRARDPRLLARRAARLGPLAPARPGRR